MASLSKGWCGDSSGDAASRFLEFLHDIDLGVQKRGGSHTQEISIANPFDEAFELITAKSGCKCTISSSKKALTLKAGSYLSSCKSATVMPGDFERALFLSVGLAPWKLQFASV